MAGMSPTRPIRITGRYILVGLLTVAPLGITWFILEFLFDQLSRIGRPWVRTLAQAIQTEQPVIARLLDNETFLSVLAVAIVVLFLWLLGWSTTRVLGRQLIGALERLIGLIPFVDTIYRATKRFLAVAGTSTDSQRRVVLIRFPSSEMKTIGLVTRTLRDAATGEELAAVYVPTAPNPTSGYVEIVPMRHVTVTDWSFDQAMAFIVTGGSNAPDSISYSQTAPTVTPPDAESKADRAPAPPL